MKQTTRTHASRSPPKLDCARGADLRLLIGCVRALEALDSGRRSGTPGLDHGTIVRSGSALEAPLTAWTKARFADEPQQAGCARRAF
jgi:hypothetical protein